MDAEQGLIVPVRVHALCVGEEESAQKGSFFSPPTATFATSLPSTENQRPFVSGSSINKPFQTGGNIDKGVHLHWFLPDALSHAYVKDAHVDNEGTDGKTYFPTAPNRWLVTRFYTTQPPGGKIQCESRSWIVESDFLSTDNKYRKSTSIPWPTDDKTPYRYLGRVVPLTEWDGESDFAKERFAPLTAVGYGELSFAIYYPNCRNVFGFHDDLDDLHDYSAESSHLSYAVVGWYSDKKQDPLNQALQDTERDIVSLLHDFGWVVDDSRDVGSLAKIICCGTVQGVQWSPVGEFIRTDMADVVVAVGNRVADGLSALLAGMTKPQEKDKVERLLEALQAGHLDELDKIDGLADLDRSVHMSFFASENGGVLWKINEVNHDSEEGKEGEPREIDPGSALKFDALNRKQSQWNSLFFEAESKREQAFLDWYKYMLFRYDEDGATKQYVSKEKDIDDDAFRDFIDPAETFDKELADLSKAIDKLKKALLRELGPGYQLQEVAAPRYFKPCDPVILLAGEEMRPTLQDSPDEKLPCLVENQLLAAIPVDDAVEVSLGDLPLPHSDKLPNCLNNLMLEVFMLDQAHLPFLAEKARGNGASQGDVLAGLENKRPRLAFLQPVVATGTSSADTALNEAGQPWNPLFMHWRVLYKPLQKIGDFSEIKSFPVDLITARFILSEETVDLDEKPAESAESEKFETYDGMTILTPHAVQNFKEVAENFLTNTGEIEAVAAGLAFLQDTPVLSQTLGGFHEALIMKKEEMQFPIMDPLDKGDAFHESIKDFVGERNTHAPMPNNYFNPVRAGEMRIDKIRVIDTFGQYKDKKFAPGEVLVSRNLIPKAGFDAAAAFLPPRIVQPSRLLLRWLAPTAPTTTDDELPIGSAVCGWLVANFLESSLLICSSTGQPIGIIQRSGEQGLLLQSSPGRAPDFVLKAGMDDFGKALHDAIPDNPVLEKYVGAMLEQDQGFYEEFLKVLDRGLESIVPDAVSTGNFKALLAGRPIALARLSIKLDLKGIAAVHQGWEALADDILQKRQKARQCALFTDIKFPVRLGSPREMNEYHDGLIGYYKEQENSQEYDFNDFYSYQTSDGHDRLGKPAQSPIELSADKASKPTTLLVLMDPQAKLSITSGILPKKSIELPTFHIEEMFSSMGNDFFVSPALCHRDICLDDGEKGVDIPTQSVAGYDWLWINKDQNDWHQIKTTGGNDDFDSTQPLIIREGWLRLVKKEETEG